MQTDPFCPESTETPEPERSGVSCICCRRWRVLYNEDAEVTGAQAARAIGVSRHLIGMWKLEGKIKPRRHRGKSPLYRLGDVIDADIAARNSGYSHRKERVTSETSAA